VLILSGRSPSRMGYRNHDRATERKHIGLNFTLLSDADNTPPASPFWSET